MPGQPVPNVATETVTVTEGGARTWWDLAGAHLGDGAAWRQLWDLNHGRVQADGTTMSTERDVLQPGWTILEQTSTLNLRPCSDANIWANASISSGASARNFTKAWRRSGMFSGA